MRCTHCDSLQTHRYGERRWHCVACGYTFRPYKKHHRRDRRWLTSYLLDGSSLRRLATRWDVCATTAWNRIQHTTDPRLDAEVLVAFRLPQTVPILLLDAKHFRFHRMPYTLYVAFDGIRKKPLAWALLPRMEIREGYDRLLRLMCRKNYRINAIVSDWHRSIRAAVHDHYAFVVHQRCAAHVLQDALRKLGGVRFLGTEFGKRHWRLIVKAAMGFSNDICARRYLSNCEKRYPRYRRAWRVVREALPDIYRFAVLPKLRIPRTSNDIENFMGFLEQRLKTMRGVKTPKSLIQIVTSLILTKFKDQPKK